MWKILTPSGKVGNSIHPLPLYEAKFPVGGENKQLQCHSEAISSVIPTPVFVPDPLCLKLLTNTTIRPLSSRQPLNENPLSRAFYCSSPVKRETDLNGSFVRE